MIAARKTLISTALVTLLLAGGTAAAQDTLVGLGPVRGYTDVVFDTTAERYDILVDASRPEDPAARRYRTIQAAYAAAPAGTRERPTVIGIRPDVYQLGGTPGEPGLTITKPNITLMGLTRDRRNVVLADNRGNKQGATNNGFTMIVDADGFSAVNLTILNYCNVDYDYPGDPSKSLKRRSGVITQAVAIQMSGDRHVYSDVAILSRLDTMFNRTKRSYFTHAYLEGTDDYLGAPGASVWEDSEINFIEGGGILFAGGTTFIRTRFRATKPMQFYKVPVAPVALIESTLPDVPLAWFGWRAPPSSEFSLTYRSKTDAGRPVDIIDSIVGPERRKLSRELTPEQSLAFNPWNQLRWAPDGNDDGWDPAGARAKFEGQGVGPLRIKLANGVSRIRTGEAPVEITAQVLPKGATGRVRWSASSPLVKLSATEGDRIVVTAANTGERTEIATIEAAADNGFSSTAYVTVDPAYRPAPALVAAPKLLPAGVDALRIAYDLADATGRKDQSLVTWFACADAACAHPERLAVTRGDAPLRTLKVSSGLAGRYVVAEVQPKTDLSQPGPARRTAPVKAPTVVSAAAVLDPRSQPDNSHADRWEGDWRLTGAWSSQAPFEDETHWGLRAGDKDNTVLYVGRPSAGDMDITATFDTDKLEGQGFSIAGSPEDEGRPRAEILFKYDPVTRDGYALRFWRSTRSATATVFQLYRIKGGHGTPISAQDQLTGVIKPTTTIQISVRGDKVTVKGQNTVDAETLDLTGTIEPNRYGAAGFYWTASRPSGSVVLRGLTVDYSRGSPSSQK